jgi:hypothetical protein
MSDGRSVPREILLVVLFLCAIGPIVYFAAGALGGLAWLMLGGLFVRYQDRYDRLLAADSVGHYFGLAGALACAATVVWQRTRPET